MKKLNILDDKLAEPEEAQKLGLSLDEFALIKTKIGRTPTFTELAMYSGMWSEHCSYKNSILLLRKLYSQSERLLAEPGEENAGALKINDKQAVIFKIESHNHPSALEPYQGAATGVGGIMRDIFTMGARPLVSLNSLRFGNPDYPRNRYLLRQVVKGVGDYGNSLGIACGGGELVFDDSYTKNPLINAMVVGIADCDKMASSQAEGIGNLVIYVGAKTGRDGIHGASFASKELSDESSEERSAVQVGDPFMEKLVMEATLECIQKNLVVAIQDMGAAGLVSSSSEMSSSGDVGMLLHLDRVPAREKNMQPFEYMLSESQERMLIVATAEKEAEVRKVYAHWNLDAVVIGEITEEKRLKIMFDDKLYADLPVHSLTVNKDGAPRYKRESQEPKELPSKQATQELPKNVDDAFKSNDISGLEAIIIKTLSHINLSSRWPLFEQYDTDIGNARLIGPGSNAGVYRVPDSEQALSVTADGNGLYVSVEPYQGSQHNVAEAYRNIISSGAEPIGITNCLNFANPHKPENYYFFERAVTAMSDAAEFFKIPITGGNVSFYNESDEGPVLPTPTLGMVGLIENYKKTIPAIVQKDDNLVLFGSFEPSLNVSSYRFIMQEKTCGALPALDLQKEKNSGELLLQLNGQSLINGAQDIAHGGLMTTLLKMLFNTNNSTSRLFGFSFQKLSELASAYQSLDEFLWGETAHSYLLSVSSKNIGALLSSAKDKNIPCVILGTVNVNPQLTVSDNMQLALRPIYDAWHNGLTQYF